MLSWLPDSWVPDDLTFAHPGRFWALLGIGLLAVVLVRAALQRRSAGQQYADAALLPGLAPHRTGWRRAPGQVLVLLAMVALTAAWAEPETLGEQAREKAVVVVVLDTSTSMLSEDVSPSRITSAKASATGFIDELPAEIDVGLVAYNETARLVAAPTPDHGVVSGEVEALPLAGGTATGDAILTALDAVQRGLPPTGPGEPPAARIVLLSDGASTLGTPVSIAVARANELGVPVSTIAFGTLGGTVFQNGMTIPVPVDAAGLQAISEATGGTTYEAQNAGALEEVYADIGSTLDSEVERTPRSAVAIGVGLLLLLVGVVPTVLLLGRVP